MILQADAGSIDLEQGFFNTKVRVVLSLPNQDASGNTNSTGTLNGGTKAKSINVTASLKFNDSKYLKDLTKIAEALESNGSRRVYTIAHDLCDAMEVRQVIFDDRLEVNQAEGKQAWNIGFSLLEYKSVPEVAEQRSPKGGAVSSGIDGDIVGDEVSLSAKGPFHSMLKEVDNFLGEKFNT